MFHDYIHDEMEKDNRPIILVCRKRAFHRKSITKHLILFHNDRKERLERIREIKRD